MQKFTTPIFMACLAAFSLNNSMAKSPITVSTFFKNFAPTIKAANILADLEGKWQFTMTPPESEALTGVLSVRRGSGPAGYVGSIMVNELRQESQTKITKAEVNGEKFLYAGEVTLDAGTFSFEMTGTIKGDKMVGQTKVQQPDGSVVYKLEATRK